MSDDFIPLNQSTPRGRSYQDQQHNSSHHNLFRGKPHRGRHNRRGNNSRNSSFGSDSNSSFSQDRNNIDAYLHPSMLEDPWKRLRQQQQNVTL